MFFKKSRLITETIIEFAFRKKSLFVITLPIYSIKSTIIDNSWNAIQKLLIQWNYVGGLEKFLKYLLYMLKIFSYSFIWVQFSRKFIWEKKFQNRSIKSLPSVECFSAYFTLIFHFLKCFLDPFPCYLR